MKKSALYMFIIAFSLITIIFPSSIVFGDTSEEPNILMNVTPEGSLFAIENMKPGDWAPRSVAVENAGKMDFSYQLILENTGEEKLFNELFLEIRDNESEIFNGKIVDFTSLPERILVAGNQEDLHLTIRFPEHLGNEFQGLDMHFSLLFVAEGIEGERDTVMLDSKIGSDGDGQEGGSLLPKTATNVFVWIMFGAILIISGSVLATYVRGDIRNT